MDDCYLTEIVKLVIYLGTVKNYLEIYKNIFNLLICIKIFGKLFEIGFNNGFHIYFQFRWFVFTIAFDVRKVFVCDKRKLQLFLNNVLLYL